MIITRTPFRISFFGGGTDYPAWFQQHGGQVLATTIDKYCYISIRQLPPFFEHRYRVVYSRIETVQTPQELQHPAVREVLGYLDENEGLEIHHDGDLPARSGLGSSSAFTVGLLHGLHALRGRQCSAQQLAEEAIHVEQVRIGEAVGSQDQVMAAHGGLRHVRFFPDGRCSANPVIVPQERLLALQGHLLLVFSGLSRYASAVAQSQINNLAQQSEILHYFSKLVDQSLELLQDPKAPLADFGRLLDQAWHYKRQLSDQVSNQTLDDIYACAMAHGALGGKVLGAGGGGFMLLFVPPPQQAAVRRALRGYVQVPFQFDNSGSKVVLYQPGGLG